MSGHHHHQGDHDSIGDRNKAHFKYNRLRSFTPPYIPNILFVLNYSSDSGVSIWDSPWVKIMAAQITNELQASLAWMQVPSNAKMLDYACGNGVVSRVRSPFPPSSNIFHVTLTSLFHLGACRFIWPGSRRGHLFQDGRLVQQGRTKSGPRARKDARSGRQYR